MTESCNGDARQCCMVRIQFFFDFFLRFSFWQDKDKRIEQLEEKNRILELALKAVALVHTPLAKLEDAPVQQSLHDAAQKVRIMQALLDARTRRA
jgi:hypothetical protein